MATETMIVCDVGMAFLHSEGDFLTLRGGLVVVVGLDRHGGTLKVQRVGLLGRVRFWAARAGRLVLRWIRRGLVAS